jgi:hypothetical protein
MTNRMEFGKAEEEIVVGSSVVGLGELGVGSAGSGRMRAPVADNKLREHIKKESQKAYAGTFAAGKVATRPTLAASGTSLTVTSESIQLQTNGPKQKSQNGKYFGPSMSFRNKPQ